MKIIFVNANEAPIHGSPRSARDDMMRSARDDMMPFVCDDKMLFACDDITPFACDDITPLCHCEERSDEAIPGLPRPAISQ